MSLTGEQLPCDPGDSGRGDIGTTFDITLFNKSRAIMMAEDDVRGMVQHALGLGRRIREFYDEEQSSIQEASLGSRSGERTAYSSMEAAQGPPPLPSASHVSTSVAGELDRPGVDDRSGAASSVGSFGGGAASFSGGGAAEAEESFPLSPSGFGGLSPIRAVPSPDHGEIDRLRRDLAESQAQLNAAEAKAEAQLQEIRKGQKALAAANDHSANLERLRPSAAGARRTRARDKQNARWVEYEQLYGSLARPYIF